MKRSKTATRGDAIRRVAGYAVIWAAAWLALSPATLQASDAPHTNAFGCTTCHMTHGSVFSPGLLTNAAVNLCLSCHVSGGTASAKPFASSDQALPWPGLPAGTNSSGTSHRWDSGAAGRIVSLGGAATNSTGAISPAGIYTGYYAKTYTLVITNAGSVGTARFNWSATSPGGGGGTNIITTNSVALDQGIFISFTDGTGVSFRVNDRWDLYVRTGLRQPTNTAMLSRLVNGAVVCATCHDQHLQLKTPFDPNAPTNTTAAGRHFMRINNDQHQMCLDCHAARNVTNALAGSHPVGIVVVTNSLYKTPTNLPVEKATARLGCLTCHDTHYVPGNNGVLLRMTNTVALCADCHRLADTNTPAAHLVRTNANMLWPGGQYGSLMPARTDTSFRGACINCHAVHGWPDAANPTNHYPVLLVDREENLCFTCHDSGGPAVRDVRAAFTNAFHHPVADSEQTAGRAVECLDCHNPHQALANGHVYTNVATSARNQVSNPLKGVSGVAFNYASLTNFSGVTTNLYAAIPQATNEYQICFKCHAGYGYPTYSSGTASFTTNSSSVTGSGTDWTSNLLGQVIFRANDPAAYVVTNVAGTTSLSVMPSYSGTSAAGQAYTLMSLPPGLTPVYTNGTASFTNGSMTVKGSGTAWSSGLAGLWIGLTGTPAVVYRITSVLNPTNLMIYPAYAETSSSSQRYRITGSTDVAQEFSPMNRSGHPIVTGLSNYVNSLAPRALLAAALKPPWDGNVGRQTMMCSDCHDATTTNYVATSSQGPHGSANQFILRGPNGNNWPNVSVSSFSSSWCANCHLNNSGDVHGKSEHGTCRNCHIVVPHGGKMSRLVADRDGIMPARYAWNNTLTNVLIYSYTKATDPANYPSDGTANCRTSCSRHDAGGSSSGTMENW